MPDLAGVVGAFRVVRRATTEDLVAVLDFVAFLVVGFEAFRALFDVVAVFLGACFTPLRWLAAFARLAPVVRFAPPARLPACFALFFDACFALFFDACFALFARFALFFDAFDLAIGEPLRPSTAAQRARL